MSKGLEALEVLKNRALSDLDSIPKPAIPICEKSNEEVMKTYETIEKELKVLDIIKKKEVNVNTLINCIIGAIEPLEFYNEKVSENLKLTQQEFYLLEEVLGE